MELLDLPHEILLRCCLHLGHADLARLAQTCKALRGVADHDEPWMRLCTAVQSPPGLARSWRQRADSAKALFRLLNGLEPLLGVWGAENLAPRGGLLYITWASFGVDAYRVIPAQFGVVQPGSDRGLFWVRTFGLCGLPNGTTRLRLIHTHGAQEVQVAGALLWHSRERREFSLEQGPLPMPQPQLLGSAERRQDRSVSPQAAAEPSLPLGVRQRAVLTALIASSSEGPSRSRRRALDGGEGEGEGEGDAGGAGVEGWASSEEAAAGSRGVGERGAGEEGHLLEEAMMAIDEGAERDDMQGGSGGTHESLVEEEEEDDEEREAQIQLPPPSTVPLAAGSSHSALLSAAMASASRDADLAVLRARASMTSSPPENVGVQGQGQGLRQRAFKFLADVVGLSPSPSASASRSASTASLAATMSLDRASPRGSLGCTAVGASACCGGAPGEGTAPSPAQDQSPPPPPAQSSFMGIRIATAEELAARAQEPPLAMAPSRVFGGFRANGTSASASASPEVLSASSALRRRQIQPAWYSRIHMTAGPEPAQPRGGSCTSGVQGQAEGEGRVKEAGHVTLPPELRDLQGLWTGVYGPHGMEILNLYCRDGEILAQKVTGDPNVPCGEVSFKAEISSRLSGERAERMWLDAALTAAAVSDDRDGPEDGPPAITSMFYGHGRVAEHNFQRPEWVPGKLFVDSSRRISFIWEDYNFLIRFRRLDLAELIPAPAYE